VRRGIAGRGDEIAALADDAAVPHHDRPERLPDAALHRALGQRDRTPQKILVVHVATSAGTRPAVDSGAARAMSSCAATATAISPGCLPDRPGMPIGQTMRSITP
jgi:hypothetical protein